MWMPACKKADTVIISELKSECFQLHNTGLQQWNTEIRKTTDRSPARALQGPLCKSVRTLCTQARSWLSSHWYTVLVTHRQPQSEEMICLMMSLGKVNNSLMIGLSAYIIHVTFSHHAGVLSSHGIVRGKVNTVQWRGLERETKFT